MQNERQRVAGRPYRAPQPPFAVHFGPLQRPFREFVENSGRKIDNSCQRISVIITTLLTTASWWSHLKLIPIADKDDSLNFSLFSFDKRQETAFGAARGESVAHEGRGFPAFERSLAALIRAHRSLRTGSSVALDFGDSPETFFEKNVWAQNRPKIGESALKNPQLPVRRALGGFLRAVCLTSYWTFCSQNLA